MIESIKIYMCSTTVIAQVRFSRFNDIYKFKNNKRANIKWKLEIRQFMADNSEEIY